VQKIQSRAGIEFEDGTEVGIDAERNAGTETMSALAQLRTNCPESPNPALLMAAAHAFSESLAIVAAATGLIVYANQAWCSMFECSDPSQLQGRPVEDLIPLDSVSVMHGAAPGTALNGERENGSGAHFVHTRRDGTRLHIEVARVNFRWGGQ
jgi:PAS domain S-box-containing protein